jgi:hypothetical protein
MMCGILIAATRSVKQNFWFLNANETLLRQSESSWRQDLARFSKRSADVARVSACRYFQSNGFNARKLKWKTQARPGPAQRVLPKYMRPRSQQTKHFKRENGRRPNERLSRPFLIF